MSDQPAPLPAVMTLAEVAALFKRRPETFARTRRAWEADRGFPKPLPGRRPALYSGREIEGWLRHPQSGGVLPPDRLPPGLNAARINLEQRFGGGHG